MVVQHLDILVRQLLAVHLLEAVGEHAAVQADEIRFGQLADERSHVLVLHVGIGVELASCRGVRSIAVLHEELQLVAHLPILGMPLAIKHISLGYRVVTLGHERDLHLVLDLLDRDAVGHADPAQDVGDHVLRSETPDRKECLGDRPLNLLHRKRLPRSVPLDNECFHND